jgi:hypothetical protein
LPIDVEYTIVDEDSHHGQDTQDGHDDISHDGQGKPVAMLTALTILSSAKEAI